MKHRIIYITGGARSGKSTFAEGLMPDEGHKVLYIATALPFDREMQDRIDEHIKRRQSSWHTLEAYRDIDRQLKLKKERYDGILLDCITLMINNLLMDGGCAKQDVSQKEASRLEEAIMFQIDAAISGLRTWGKLSVIVSNEVGMGLVPDNPLGRLFRDIAGRANQRIASEADMGYFMVSGVPIRFK